MFRSASTYAPARRRSGQLDDSRASPTSTPITDASAMPAAAMRMVFTMPTQSARPPVSGLVSMPQPTLMPM